MTFGVARDLYRNRKYVDYGSYGPPIGNHVITSGPKLPYVFKIVLKSWTKTAIVLQLRWSSGAKVTVIACCIE